MIRSNISKGIRELNAITSGPNSIYKKAGSQLRSAILEEFKTLVRETPQWSGTTAASWKLGFMYKVDQSMVEMPQPASREEALSRGAEPACQIAINNAMGALSPDLRDYMRIGRGGGQDIVLYNEAPGYETAEEGPVRPVNVEPGALKRFESRIDSLDILVDFLK